MTGSINVRYAYDDFRRDMTGAVVYAAVVDFGIPGHKFLKVGHSRELIDRLAGIQTGCPVQIGDVAYARMPSIEAAVQAERLVHRAMAKYSTQGEWFKFDMGDPEHVRVWRGAIPAVLNHVVGKGKWSLKSVNYAEIRAAMAEAKSERFARLKKRRLRH